MPVLNSESRENVRKNLVDSLSPEPEVRRIVVFGSFLSATEPSDVDVAVFQDSTDGYLQLAMKYRRLTRNIAKTIALDILPLRESHYPSAVPSNIAEGQVIYER
ncbi:nucleotidyltransferase domain-containing protein [Desulfonatronum thioautotrophicum]|uniref:nucleotidyltransferase domain-containing protein n=1 Tax=Desulfonatronum thioautotrophicum TaxID=617001 RepID=UPI0005EB4652